MRFFALSRPFRINWLIVGKFPPYGPHKNVFYTLSLRLSSLWENPIPSPEREEGIKGRGNYLFFSQSKERQRLSLSPLAEPGTGRDQLADDDVLLQADQVVYAAHNGRLSQNPRGLLEGSCGQPAIGVQ